MGGGWRRKRSVDLDFLVGHFLNDTSPPFYIYIQSRHYKFTDFPYTYLYVGMYLCLDMYASLVSTFIFLAFASFAAVQILNN